LRSDEWRALRLKIVSTRSRTGSISSCSRPSARARSRGGADLTIDRDRDKNPVVALREIADETVRPRELEEAIVTNLQKVRIDEEDETEELASLSEAAEALRLTAAAPPRPTPSGGDYE